MPRRQPAPETTYPNYIPTKERLFSQKEFTQSLMTCSISELYQSFIGSASKILCLNMIPQNMREILPKRPIQFGEIVDTLPATQDRRQLSAIFCICIKGKNKGSVKPLIIP